MELRNDECKDKQNRCRHIFVINDAKIKNGKVVLYVSSKDIDIEFDSKNTNSRIKKLKKIPTGPFHHARFDIDANSDANSVCVKQCNAGNPPSTFNCTQICNSNSCLSYMPTYLSWLSCPNNGYQDFCQTVTELPTTASSESFNNAYGELLTCNPIPYFP